MPITRWEYPEPQRSPPSLVITSIIPSIALASVLLIRKCLKLLWAYSKMLKMCLFRVVFLNDALVYNIGGQEPVCEIELLVSDSGLNKHQYIRDGGRGVVLIKGSIMRMGD